MTTIADRIRRPNEMSDDDATRAFLKSDIPRLRHRGKLLRAKLFAFCDQCGLPTADCRHLKLLICSGKFFDAKWLSEAQQHSKESEEADEDQQNSDSNDWRLLTLLGNTGDWRKGFAPQITNGPPVLPNRDD